MKNRSNVFLGLLVLITTLFLSSCGLPTTQKQTADSGVKKAHTEVKTDAAGNTTEQWNIINRLKRDNEVGSIKHLYVVSSYTGDVLEYSTVRGKVTSGGKRLSPKTVVNTKDNLASNWNYTSLNGQTYITDEVLDDGGAYGDSGNYLFWFDAQNNYHQYYPSGGTYLHIADRPLRVKKANFTMELIQTTTNTTETTTTSPDITGTK